MLAPVSGILLDAIPNGAGLQRFQDEIVRAHGGRLELASKPGQGSRFTILLPLLNLKTVVEPLMHTDDH